MILGWQEYGGAEMMKREKGGRIVIKLLLDGIERQSCCMALESIILASICGKRPLFYQ